MPKSQRRWKSQAQQQALIEFDLVRLACPSGIYLCITPGNFALWSGVLFVKKGPYAPAVLRFQLAFPPSYPNIPPLILFTSDVFHPLVTPLTTYTYSTSSSSADTVSATDEERLLPGGFSLRHGFPSWFKQDRERKSEIGGESRLLLTSESETTGSAQTSVRSKAKESSLNPEKDRPVFQPPPKDEGTSVGDARPTIIELLVYLKDVFEDESLLDVLPLEAAGNPGAWNAWQAHRRKARPPKHSAEGIRLQPKVSQQNPGVVGKPKIGSWNWDGVWVDRVKKCVNNSLAESMLYGGVDGDDLVGFMGSESRIILTSQIHFLDLEDDASNELRQSFRARDNSMVQDQI